MLAERLGVAAYSSILLMQVLYGNNLFIAKGARDDHCKWEAERNMAKFLVTLAEKSCTRLGIEGSPRDLVSKKLLCKIWHDLIKEY